MALGRDHRFETRQGAVAVHRSLAGVRASYEDLRQRAVTTEVGQIQVPVAGYDDLIRIKRATGGREGLAEIAALEGST